MDEVSLFPHFNPVMNRFKNLIIVLLAFTSLAGCKEEQIACTEEFRYIGIKVLGDILTDYYTVRLSTMDTLRVSDSGFPEEYWYPVLTDSYQVLFPNKTETFRFIGEVNDVVEVSEDFVISADDCHISKVSGTEQVIL